MATRKSSKKKRERKDPGDSPITVGGGGGLPNKLRKKLTPKQLKLLVGRIWIQLDNNWYTPKHGDCEQQKHKDDELTMFTVYDGAVGTPHAEVDSGRTVTIYCIAENGHNSSIIIKGNDLGVKFDRDDYSYDYAMRMYISDDLRAMGDIKVNGKPDIPHREDAYIVVDNKLKKPTKRRR